MNNKFLKPALIKIIKA